MPTQFSSTLGCDCAVIQAEQGTIDYGPGRRTIVTVRKVLPVGDRPPLTLAKLTELFERNQGLPPQRPPSQQVVDANRSSSRDEKIPIQMRVPSRKPPANLTVN